MRQVQEFRVPEWRIGVGPVYHLGVLASLVSMASLECMGHNLLIDNQVRLTPVRSAQA